MIPSLLKKIFGSRNDRLLKQYRRTVVQINDLEAGLTGLTDEQLRGKTAELKAKYAAGTSLDDLLPEAFAVCREASKRVLGMRHFDAQLIGGMVLHYGKIAEMRTGEGKTLMATLPSYLNALSGKGVHVVTVNDYLAQRDAEWMGRLYNFLGLAVGLNLSQMPHDQKQQAYLADITYGTNNEYGFDYLRDNMVHDIKERVQRGLNFAVIDEVDSILIDEARTPLIISGQADDHTDLYQTINVVPAMLIRQENEEADGHYYVDEKAHQIHISDAGFERAEQILTEMGLLPTDASLYDSQNIQLLHHLNAALKAHALFFKDQHYVVQRGEIVIVDEFTGRLMTGRRWSDGLHQAVEAKEGVKINPENQTLASITFQNYFRMYKRLSGMTGTADTEAFEFQQIYNLETVVIPTHRPMIRQDLQDQVFRSADEKYRAILSDIQTRHERGQPILVGTTSIENSELLSSMLRGAKLPHEVLNAKQHAREAEIVAQAGRPGAITIATNMAGRGTDIVLGGNVEKQAQLIEANEALDEATKAAKVAQLKSEWQGLHEKVLAAGGLHIVGTERHESRRIDNQLRGRAGRQGDPGSSRFYLSMDDPLLRIFAGERMKAIMERLKLPDGEPIEAGIVTRSLESAQRKVENRNFDIRKQLLEYDDVANEQRKVLYVLRNEMLEAESISASVQDMRHEVLTEVVHHHVPAESLEEQWNLPALEQELADQWQVALPLNAWVQQQQEAGAEDIVQHVIATADQLYADRVAIVSAEAFQGFERSVMLQHIDHHWREHLAILDHLRQGIHLRGYAQKNPKQEYKREAFELFQSTLGRIRTDVTKLLMNVQIQSPDEAQVVEAPAVSNVTYTHAPFGAEMAMGDADPEAVALALQDVGNTPIVGEVQMGVKVGRNEPCPCGSGKKYKFCHGKLA